MTIPTKLIEKSSRHGLKVRSVLIIERGWEYLKDFFEKEEDYFKFLENLSVDQFNNFLHTIFFYHAHNLYRIPETGRIKNIDGFMYQTTLSVVEYLNRSISGGAKAKIKDFFKNYFELADEEALNDKIKVAPLSSNVINLSFWEILYDMRKDFIHEANWFLLLEEAGGAFATIINTKHKQGGRYIEYTVDVRIGFQNYMKFFWKGYLRYFGRK